MAFSLFTDGGSRGNPGHSAIGFFLFDNERLVDFGGRFQGISTNNNAEYSALLLGLKACRKNYVDEVNVYMDSELVVKQLKGEYKINNEDLKSLLSDVRNELKFFKTFSINHVPREDNKFADKLVNLILDSRI